ncbi:MAG TPA: hypothetical protein VJW94_19055 [Candidatus Acidoferrum sp.]|nr:hypothetical protein [Candidatus Acidoferrum sp.]
MNSSAISPPNVLVPILLCLEMTFAAGATLAQCPNRGTVFEGEVSTSQGTPYRAKAIRTIVTYGGDGTKRTVVAKANLFRDSAGRTRIERFYDGSADPSENVPGDILIDDSCGTSVILLPARQTAKITKRVLSPKISDRPYCREIDLKNPPYVGPEGKFEDLGHKLIDGIEIRGERWSTYSSAQAKLTGAPPVSVLEDWCSISLDTPMGGYILSDKPKREITTVISDIRQIEPDPALFEIPAEYKIIPAGEGTAAANLKVGPPGASPLQ